MGYSNPFSWLKDQLKRLSKKMRFFKKTPRDLSSNQSNLVPQRLQEDRIASRSPTNASRDNAEDNHERNHTDREPRKLATQQHEQTHDSIARVVVALPESSPYPQPTRRNTFLRSLRTKLSEEGTRIGIQKQGDCFTEAELNRIITKEEVDQAIPTADETIKAYALSSNKIFAILVLLLAENDLIHTLKRFNDHKINNKSLPILKLTNDCTHRGDDDEISPTLCCHDPKFNVFHHDPWDAAKRRDFYEKQWLFLVPVLSLSVGTEVKNWHNDYFLPVTKLDEKLRGSGYFSDVYCGQILAECVAGAKTQDQKWIPVAIKELKNHADQAVEIDWKREIEPYLKFNPINHPHLTRGIAAFNQNDRYYILLEWAEGDNLRRFWEAKPDPVLTPDFVLEFLKAMLGLMGALYVMHYDVDSTSPHALSRASSFSATPSEEITSWSIGSIDPQLASPSKTSTNDTKDNIPTIQIADFAQNGTTSPPGQPIPTFSIDESGDIGSNSTGARNWRHGDIKPENILVFPKIDSHFGILKLGDMGRAKEHKFDTASPERMASGEKFRTRQYEPPEAVLDKKGARSRKYDIWSMGAVIWESTCYCLFGFDGQQKLQALTSSGRREQNGTRYWISDGGLQAKVNPDMEKFMNNVLTNHPECKIKTGQDGKGVTALRDLILLIKDKMLVVRLNENDPPTLLGQKFRANASSVCDELRSILDKAEKEPDYLLRSRGQPKTELSDCIELPKRESLQLNSSLKSPDTITQNGTHNVNGMLHVNSLHPGSHLPASHNVWGPTASSSRIDSYAHEERDIWEQRDDDDFALQTLKDETISAGGLLPVSDSQVCESCQNRNFESQPFHIQDSIKNLERASKRGCELCTLLMETARRAGISENGVPYFDVSESRIKLNWAENPLVLSIRQTSAQKMSRIRAGLPSLPAPGSNTQFEIMRRWISDCNKHTQCDVSDQSHERCPTRLLDVGSRDGRIYVIEKTSLEAEINKSTFKYVALSHPWGADSRQHFISTQENIYEHISKGIPIERFPNTFRDAIKITQNMDIKYLWIDSLCILQGPGGDFENESRSMEYVFTSAYFTIAASSALGTSDQLFRPRPISVLIGQNAGLDKQKQVVLGQRKVVRLKSKNSGRPIFITECLDNFQADVLDGPLNGRGWVFQERALSRRTIHLTDTQAYWECGAGIRCESLTKLWNPKVRFLGDPKFPDIAKRLNRGGQIYYYESLYEQYSRLHFTYHQDKSVAIYGLETRICRELDDLGGFGVFRKHLGRGLLWQRGDGVKTLRRIQFSNSSGRGHVAPSWSWMSYIGGINFLSPVGGSVVWESSISWKFENGEPGMRLNCVVKSFNIPAGTETTDASIEMDVEAESDNLPSTCVVVGKQKLAGEDAKKMHFVLILRWVSFANDTAIFERVGVGRILGRFIMEDDTCNALIR